MKDVIALVPTRLKTTALGLPSLVARPLAGQCVLRHTVARLARVKQVRAIVLLHGPDEKPLNLLEDLKISKPVHSYVDPSDLVHRFGPKLAAARAWSLTAWRGGLGGASCYDELLPTGPMLAAMQEHRADSALLAGADWPLVDPGLCEQVLELHLEFDQAMQMVFTQAPPGLAGIAVGQNLIAQLAENNASFGQVLAYNPAKPQADPIGRDVCKQVPAAVRSCVQRFIYDTPASAAMIDWVADRLGPEFSGADAQAVASAASKLDTVTADRFASLPQMITLELTPRRSVRGPITPHHYVQLQRPDMPLELALRLVGQMGQDRDIALTLGGLGDALLYEHWEKVVLAAREAGVMGIALETDLLVDRPVVEKLLELPIDVVSVRLNADTAAVYQKAMDPDDTLDNGFAKVIGNLEWLVNERNRRTQPLLEAGDVAAAAGRAGLPWLVQRMVKTADTLSDLETFFDRWVYYTGHAVVEPATSGCGLMPELSPVRMDPPVRTACRQVPQRMTIHSDGRVALCDQDWLGRACAGNAAMTPLAEIWQAMRPVRQTHEQGRWGELELCGSCREWHRP